jgi:cytochrome bd-type quinol oxidase subunit 2
MAPLQKRALCSLLIGLAMAAALTAVFVIKGDVNALDDQDFRYIVYLLWIGVPLVYLILVNLTLRKPTQIDERDRLIMERAPKTQLIAIFFSLAAWLIILTEVYRSSGQIPIIYLTLIFISALIVSTLAQSLGILIGYWRMDNNA